MSSRQINAAIMERGGRRRRGEPSGLEKSEPVNLQ